MPDWPKYWPPGGDGGGGVADFLASLMDERGWGRNRLTSGSMDELEFLVREDGR